MGRGGEQSFKGKWIHYHRIRNIGCYSYNHWLRFNFDETALLDALNNLAIAHADGLIVGSENISDATMDAMKATGLPMLNYHGEEGYVGDINNFYDSILEGKAEAVS